MRSSIITFLLAICSVASVAQPALVFYEDFENPPGNVSTSGSPGWFTNSRLQVSGINSDSSSVAPAGISYLETGSFNTLGNLFVTLNFKSICKAEFFDAGTIEISINGGPWTQLIDNNPNLGTNNCSYLGTGLFATQNSKFGEASYGTWLPGQTVAPDNSWWKTESFDISLLAANQPDVRIRFALADGNNNGSGGRNGWFVDDIEVIAAPCELNPPNMYPLAPNYSGTIFNLGPYTVNCAVTDQSFLQQVTLYYTVNGVFQNPIPMTNTIDSLYEGIIPTVNDGDTICYYIEALDNSGCFNFNYLPAPGQSTCFVAAAGISFPYCDNFDITTNLWTASTQTPGTQWELGTPAYGATSGAYSTPNSWDVNLGTAYLNNATCFLTSPEFSFTIGAGATLEFWQNRNAEQAWDGVRLEWATSLAGPWNILGSLQGTAGCVDCVNWYNDDALNSGGGLAAWTGNSNGWIKSSITLGTQFNNLPQCWFRFVFTSDASVITDGFSIDNFCISLPQPDDVGVSAVVQPGPTGPAGNCLDVIVTVKNNGVNNQTTFPVSYSINGGPAVTATYNGLLTPGQTANFTLPCFNVPVGPYTVCAWTSLPGDGNNFNDTLCVNSLGIPVFTPTFCDDFESGNQGYQTTSTNVGTAWQLGTPAFGATTGAFSGTNAWDINLNTPYNVGTNADLITPIFDLAGTTNSYLSFRRKQNCAQNDGLRISYNVNGTGNWVVMGTLNDPDGFNWYNTNQLNFAAPGWTGSTAGSWVESRYYLQNLINATGANFIQFRFEFVAGFNGVPNDGVSIDDLCVKQPGPNDVGVVAITSPTANSAANSTSPVNVTLRNFGSSPQTTIPVSYTINGGTLTTATYNGNLAPGATTNFVMPGFTVPSGQYDFCAWTGLAGDSDNSNDTTCKSSVGVPVVALSYTSPYFDNFNGVNIGWTPTNPGAPGNDWQLGVPAFGATSSAFSAPNAWDINLNGAYTNNANSILTSPIFDFTNAVDAKLSFRRNHLCENFWDGTRLEYSVNGGPWTLLGGANLTAPCWVNWYNSTPTINSSGLPAWTAGTGGWVLTEAKCLNFLDNVGLVQFRFIFTSDASVTQDGFSIDDFKIEIPVPLTAAPLTIASNAINNSFIFPGQQVQFNSNLSNPGTTPLSSVNATITVTPVGGSTPVLTFTDPVNYTPALASQASLNHVFSQIWTAAPGVYDVCVITSLPNGSADLNPFDDTTCITISVFDSVTITSNNPYCNDFESGPQWVSVNAQTYNATTNSWQIGSPSKTILNGAYSGSNAWVTNLTSNYPNRDTSGLFSPVFGIENTKCYKLSFWHKFNSELFQDGGTVEYSTDNALTWQHLGFASSTPQNWFNSTFITSLGGNPGLPGWSGTQSTWTLAEKEMNFYVTGNIIFRFRFASDASTNNFEGWAIDDFCFEEVAGNCATSITENPVMEGLALGQNVPNPFNNTSEIGFAIPSEGQVRISITDVLGKVVAVPVDGNKAVGMHTFTINSADLGVGLYYYTLEFKGEKITRKMAIIK
jgi:hypothetical protein